MNIQHIQDILNRAVDTKECAGASVVVLHKGREAGYAEAGYADIEAGKKISRDTMFRIYSQSKPVTGFASARLVERGAISPRQPVSDFLPGFRGQKYLEDGVWKECGEEPVRILHLLNMTSGVPYPGDPADGVSPHGAVARVHAEAAKLRGKGEYVGTVELMNRVGRCGLAFRPGSRWEYGHSADVMGAVIEVASGKSFGEHLREEIFGPLGMKDTAFVVPKEKRGRLAKCYELKDGGFSEYDYANWHLGLNNYDATTAFESGGAGLVSTIDDYARFANMFDAGGVAPDGTRLITEQGLRFFSSPQLLPRQLSGFNWLDCEGQNYGNFVWIRTRRGLGSTVDGLGTFSWGGWLGTSWFYDPESRVGMVFMVQHMNTDDHGLFYRLRNAAYFGLFGR